MEDNHGGGVPLVERAHALVHASWLFRYVWVGYNVMTLVFRAGGGSYSPIRVEPPI